MAAIIGGAAAASLLPSQLMRIAFDVELVGGDPPGNTERTMIFHVSALTPALAKLKVRLFTLYLSRPKRKITSAQIGAIESGILIKKYQVTVKAKLFGAK